MAKQTITVVTTTSRQYVSGKSNTTTMKSGPGKSSIGSKGNKGNSLRCPSCGRYMNKSKR